MPRRAARTLLLDPQDRVLLIRYDSDGYIFWVTPGGAVEPGETDVEAAARELMEELRITAELYGPVHSTTSSFHHEGRYVENTDIFFATRSATTDAPQCHAVSLFEKNAMRHARWWSLQDLQEASEDVFPKDLAEIVARVSPLLR
ncbi:NUDIX hydrolase [Terriglobus roseus]|uniref:8-oxo-dGTP pyrophosphatase MutT, NUDIX family n=1 Tax=Terriglobus roseus TaxID=392734 RepID=A0A1H4JHA7_9BACT|nr:NUDIX domain-containing protein [Terriglobus roseus]SEB45008.1 8-oxo-dGTP pyrophosphatase MutT, NUDIX family [Terriglobus roseus]